MLTLDIHKYNNDSLISDMIGFIPFFDYNKKERKGYKVIDRYVLK